MGSGLYTLDSSGQPIPCDDSVAWSRWFESFHNRQVRTTVLHAKGHPEFRLSTIFLGIDHAWGGGPPVLWETMVLDAPDDNDRQARFTSRVSALLYHDLMLVQMATLFGASVVVPELPSARVVKSD